MKDIKLLKENMYISLTSILNIFSYMTPKAQKKKIKLNIDCIKKKKKQPWTTKGNNWHNDQQNEVNL